MTEQLITFETAKLAREKGFKLPMSSELNFYGRNEIVRPMKWFLPEELANPIYAPTQALLQMKWFLPEELANPIYAPTQALLQKWLREEFHIIVEVRFIAGLTRLSAWYDYVIYAPEKFFSDTGNDEKLRMRYKTYEESLEKGIQEALKLIK